MTKPSIMQACTDYLSNTKEDVIKASEFRKVIAKECGTSPEVIRGTIMSCSGGKLMGDKTFQETWMMVQSPSRFVRKSYAEKNGIKEYTLSYNTPFKTKD